MSWCRRLFPAAALAAACCAGFDALAADWTWGGSLSGRVEQISNATLGVPPGASAQRRSLTGDVGASARGETWEAAANAQYAINSSNLPQLGQDSYSFGLNANRQFERDKVGFAASLRRESTLTSELAATGASFALAQRETLSLAPNWRRSLTERLSLVADASYQSVAYDRRSASLVDFASTSASGGLAWTLSPRTELRFIANASRTRTDPFTSASDTAGWSASVQHTLNEHWSFSAAYGPSRIRSRFASSARICPVPSIFCEAGLVPFTFFPVEVERVSAGDTWNASATYTPREHTTLVLQTSRAVSPSGGGGLADIESSSAALTHRFSDRLSASLDAGKSSSSTVSVTSGASTQARRAGASLSWQLDERLSLDAGARWQQLRTGTGAGSAPESTTVFVALRYSLQRRVLR